MTAPDSTENENSVQVSFAEKEILERKNRLLLFDDLLNNRLQFSGGPYEAHIQFSNFCNMSCIMCWDGNNPPTRKTPPQLLEKIGEQIGRHVSIVTPYSGSEPLVLTWDETRDMANKFGILMCITTNVQFLDEKKFHDLKDITETLILSIDSHIPAVFEKIRPRSNSKKVFANLETAAKLSVEHNLECIVNIVFMTQNTPMLTDTLEYLADLGIQNVNLIQLLDVNGETQKYDPLIHFSDEYVSWIKRECIATAKARKFRLIWSIAGYAEYDYREPGYIKTKARKLWNDESDLKLKMTFPGFCRNAYDRLRVDSDGDVAPCCYATEGELSLGNLNEQSFDEIWNGTEARDLRRGMYTGDVPALCKSCRFHDTIPPFTTLPFIEQHESELKSLFDFPNEQTIPGLEIVAPNHGTRTTHPVEFKIGTPGVPIKSYEIVLSLGGDTDETFRQTFEPTEFESGYLSFSIDNELWKSLKHNVGYWWMIWAIPADSAQKPLRCNESRCFIRHKEIQRIEQSTLRYLDQGYAPVSDLGGGKIEGWVDKNQLQQRPLVALHGRAKKAEPLASLPAPIQPTPSAPQPPAAKTSLLSWLRGSSPQPESVSGFRDGFLDVVIPEKDSITIEGWILLNNGVSTISIVGPNGHTVAAKICERIDIAAAYPTLATAINSGFKATLPDEWFWHNQQYEFDIVSQRNGKVEFRCRVSCRGGRDSNQPAGPYCIRNGTLEI